MRKGFQRSDMETLEEYFSTRVSAFLDDTGLSPTRLGRMALGDPNLMRRIERRPLAEAADGGPCSGVHLRFRPAVGRRAPSAPPPPEACIESEEKEEEQSDERTTD